MHILGIETSCDETSVAVLRDGAVLSSLTYSQQVHARFGGVVPELASRAHLQKIDRLAGLALADCGLAPDDLDLIAVTDAPGLAGALLVGISFALGLHAGFGVPLTGVNHLEGHMCSVLLEHGDLPFPHLALVVSGGHTAIYRVDDPLTRACLGQTVDDAAGEAFDKIGKLLGFAYPAGQRIEKEAEAFDGTTEVRFPVAKVGPSNCDFSFSGLKTAAKYHLESRPGLAADSAARASFCSAFQRAIVDALTSAVARASGETGIRTVAAVGGVACNGALRRGLQGLPGLSVWFPSPRYCTDNGAMIARAGYERARRGTLTFPRMQPTSRRAAAAGPTHGSEQ